MEKTCASDKIFNPATGRCVLRRGKIGKSILAGMQQEEIGQQKSYIIPSTSTQKRRLSLKKKDLTVEDIVNDLIRKGYTYNDNILKLYGYYAFNLKEGDPFYIYETSDMLGIPSNWKLLTEGRIKITPKINNLLKKGFLRENDIASTYILYSPEVQEAKEMVGHEALSIKPIKISPSLGKNWREIGDDITINGLFS